MSGNVLPVWLDPRAELRRGEGLESFTFVGDGGVGWWERASGDERMVAAILGCFRVCMGRVSSGEIDLERLFWVVGNVISEQGWFRNRMVLGNNLGGWKINQGHVREWKRMRAAGELKNKPEWDSPPWFRDEGHVASGDDPEVYYRVFGSVDEFFGEWLGRFVPKPGTVGIDHRYYKAGMEFWRGNPTAGLNGWFRELCLAGYKGPVTQASPEKSVRNYWSIVRRLKVIVAQALLNLEYGGNSGVSPPKPDGSWGSKSKELAAKFIQENMGGDGKGYVAGETEPSQPLLEVLLRKRLFT